MFGYFILNVCQLGSVPLAHHVRTMASFGNFQRDNCWLFRLEHSQRMPWVEQSIDEDHIGHIVDDLLAAIIVVNPIHDLLDVMLREIVVKHVPTHFDIEIRRKRVTKWLEGTGAGQEVAKFGTALVFEKTGIF